MIPKNREDYLKIFLISFACYCALTIGESWDEGFHFKQGKITLNYLLSLGQIKEEIFNGERYSPSYWTLQYFITQIFSPKYQILVVHFTNLLISLATIIGLGKLIKEIFNKEAGKIVMIILFFYPVFFGHMGFNGKDTILAFSHIWITYLLIKYIKYHHDSIKINKYVILIALLTTLSTGVQIAFIGSLLPILLFIAADIFFFKKLRSKKFDNKRLFFDLLKFLVIFYFSLILFWIDTHPNIFTLPYKFFIGTLSEDFWSGWPFTIINGEYFYSDKVSKLYIIKNIIFKSPEYFLILYIIFFFLFLKIRLFYLKKIKNFNYLIIFLLIILSYPHLIMFVLPYNVYDGLRLFMWTIPYYCIIPGLTAYFIYKNLDIWYSKLILSSISILFIFFIFNFISLTPYQYIYLNLLTGEKKTRYLKFENDYWGGSIKELVEKSTLKKNEDILITSCGINKKLAKKYFKKNGFSKVRFVNEQNANYVIMTNRIVEKKIKTNKIENLTNCFDRYSGKDLNFVKRNGQVLSIIRKIN